MIARSGGGMGEIGPRTFHKAARAAVAAYVWTGRLSLPLVVTLTRRVCAFWQAQLPR